jgi:hypothetical protein
MTPNQWKNFPSQQRAAQIANFDNGERCVGIAKRDPSGADPQGNRDVIGEWLRENRNTPSGGCLIKL